jgi:serine/threonine-protein kinase RsbW
MRHAAPATRILLDERIDASLEEVSRVCAQVAALARSRGGEEWAGTLDLGLTEAMTNVVRHGYSGRAGLYIDVRCTDDGQWLQLQLGDCGTPIPAPLWAAADGSVFDFDPNDVQTVPEGGMGLSLIRACFDESSYHSDAQGNHLLLRKRMPTGAA